MKPKVLITVMVCAFILMSCGEFQQVFQPEGASSRSIKPPRVARVIKTTSSLPNVSTTLVEVPNQIEREPIITRQGTYYYIKTGDNLAAIARRYRIDDEQLAQINELVENEMLVGRRLFIPNRRTRSDYLVVAQAIRDDKPDVDDRKKGSVHFAWPVKGAVLTSPFGWRRGRNHDGLDLGAKPGTPIYAAEDGRVLFSKRFAGYGNLLVLKHAQNYYTAYAHATSLFVGNGDKVKQGQQIATIGSTGHSTGPHLHFEIHKGTQSIDPKPLLPADMPPKP